VAAEKEGDMPEKTVVVRTSGLGDAGSETAEVGGSHHSAYSVMLAGMAAQLAYMAQKLEDLGGKEGYTREMDRIRERLEMLAPIDPGVD
jgi:hypothetical protein